MMSVDRIPPIPLQGNKAERALCLLVALIWLGAPALGQGLAKKASLDLIGDRTAYEPGSTATLAAAVEIEPGWHVQSHEPSHDYLIPTVLELELPSGWSEPRIEYPEAILWEADFAEGEALAVYEGVTTILAELELPPERIEELVEIRGKLTYQACDDKQCLPPTTAEAVMTLRIGSGGEAVDNDVFGGGGASPAGPARGLALMLLLGVLGGLILNAMPCVLPILSLKIFGLVRSASHGRAAVVAGSLATAAGIVASFWLLAGAAVVARATGNLVGWGVQFQNPGFVAFLTVVVFLFCLNLWGLFEIPLPQRLGQLASSGSGGRGLAGHLTTGLFATLMATPCSAPFLGTAVGFGLSQDAPVIFAIFTAVGLGMALPYLLLAAAPRAAGILPKPGEWMNYLKGIMGFLLAAAGVWLLYVLAAQISAERLALLELTLLVVALFTWLGHAVRQRPWMRRAAALGVLVAGLGTIFVAVQGDPTAAGSNGFGGTSGNGRAPSRNGLIAWTEFDRQHAEGLVAEGRLVFVDVTADWCFTCKVNERLVLETPEVATAFEKHAVIAMKADWTNKNDAIASYMEEFGRYGIPFYLLYRKTGDPHLFGELLTKGEVLSVLEAEG